MRKLKPVVHGRAGEQQCYRHLSHLRAEDRILEDGSTSVREVGNKVVKRFQWKACCWDQLYQSSSSWSTSYLLGPLHSQEPPCHLKPSVTERELLAFQTCLWSLLLLVIPPALASTVSEI